MNDPLGELIQDNIAELVVNTSLLFFILGHLVNTGAVAADDLTQLLEDQASRHTEARIVALFRARADQWRGSWAGGTPGPTSGSVLRLVAMDGMVVAEEALTQGGG